MNHSKFLQDCGASKNWTFGVYNDINMATWGETRKERLWFNSDVSVCKVEKGSIVLVVFVNLTQTEVTWEFNKELSTSDWPWPCL